MGWVGVRTGGSVGHDERCVEERRSRVKTEGLSHKLRAKHSHRSFVSPSAKSRARPGRSEQAAEDLLLRTCDPDDAGQHIPSRTSQSEPPADAVERERRRIARDLHDHAGQYFVGIGLRLAALEICVSDETARASLHEIHDLVDHFNDELRTICRGERGTAPCARDLRTSLGQMMTRWEHEVGIPVQFDWPTANSAEIDDAVSEAVFRLVQEALTNVAKHAMNASLVAIRLRTGTDMLELAVSDNGASASGSRRSLAANQTEHCGISGMRERVMELGGRFDVRHQAQKGTSVLAELPLRITNGHRATVLS